MLLLVGRGSRSYVDESMMDRFSSVSDKGKAFLFFFNATGNEVAQESDGGVYVGNGLNNWKLKIGRRAAYEKSKGPAWNYIDPSQRRGTE